MSTAALRRIENDYRETQTGVGNFDEKVGDILTNTSRSKYDINVIRFPEILGTDPSLQHYVSFSINIRGKSQYNTGNERLFTVTKNNDAQLTSDELANATKGLAKVAGAALGASIGSMAAKKIAGAVAKTGGTTAQSALGKRTVDTAIQGTAVVAGAVVGAKAGKIAGDVINSVELLKPDVSYRISDVIALHLEEKPSVKYSASYSNKDLGTLAGVLGQTGGGDLTETLKNAVDMGGEIASAAILGLAKLPSMFGGTDFKSIMSAGAKVALNPFREVLFEAIDFRTFNFKYRLMPKSKNETEQIQRIIKLFKFHMHPELSENRLFFIYPAEFQIAYFFKNAENRYFHKFAPCALTDLQVDYGGEQFSSFRDGAPGEVNLSLTFRETEILTKEKIIQGY